MSWLKRVIGMVLNTTQTATPVPPTQDGLIGGSNNTVEQPKPVRKGLKPKRSNAKVVTQGKLRKAETSCVRTPTKKSSTLGTQPATPVHQSAKQKPKSSKKAVPKATQVKSPKPVPKPVRKTTGQKAR
jgi:hypothetical protein